MKSNSWHHRAKLHFQFCLQYYLLFFLDWSKEERKCHLEAAKQCPKKELTHFLLFSYRFFTWNFLMASQVSLNLQLTSHYLTETPKMHYKHWSIKNLTTAISQFVWNFLNSKVNIPGSWVQGVSYQNGKST